MIFIVVKWPVKPEHADRWLELVQEFTRATRAEPGNLFFEWSRDVEDPTVFTLVEAFRDGDAGREHVRSEHFRKAVAAFPDYVAGTPSIVHVEVPQEGWGEMAEVRPR